MPKEIAYPLFAGIAASMLFLLVFGIGLGFIFMFLPTLPILLLGLSRSSFASLQAAGVGAFVIALAVGPSSAILFLYFRGLPSWYIARESLRRYEIGEARFWFPLGLIFVQLTLWGCIAVALLTAYYVPVPGGLPKLLSDNIRSVFGDLQQSEYADMVDALADRWSFLVFSITIWMWGIALYAHAWMAHRVLKEKSSALRPDFSLTPFSMPNWMLSLMAIAMLASLIGSDSMRFLGKSTVITLLLPYFFLGTSLIHHMSRSWVHRRFYLFLFYFTLLSLFWPALVVALYGLGHHIKRLSKHPTSSKS